MSVTQQDEYEEGEIVDDDDDDVIIVSESFPLPVLSVEKPAIQINNVPSQVNCKKISFQVNAQTRFRNNGVINFERKCESLLHFDGARNFSRDRCARRHSREDRRSRIQSYSRPDEKLAPAKSSNLRFSGKDSNHNEDISFNRRQKPFENRQMRHRKNPVKTDEREDRLKVSHRKVQRAVKTNRRKSVSLVKVEETNTSLLKRLVGSGSVGIKNLRDLENSNKNSISSPSTDVELVTEIGSPKTCEVDSKPSQQPDEDDELNRLRIEALKTAMLRKHSNRIKRGVVPKKNSQSSHKCNPECQEKGCEISLEMLDNTLDAENSKSTSSSDVVGITIETNVATDVSISKCTSKRPVDQVSALESEPKRKVDSSNKEVDKSDDTADELALLRSLALKSVQDRSKDNSKNKLENGVPNKSDACENGICKEVISCKNSLPSSPGGIAASEKVTGEVDPKVPVKTDPEGWEEVDEDILRAQLLQTLSGNLPESKLSNIYTNGAAHKSELSFIKRLGKSKGSSVTSVETDEELEKLCRIWSERMVPSLVISLGSDSDSDTDHVEKSVDKFLNEARALVESTDVKKAEETNKEDSNVSVEPSSNPKPATKMTATAVRTAVASVKPAASAKTTVAAVKPATSTAKTTVATVKPTTETGKTTVATVKHITAAARTTVATLKSTAASTKTVTGTIPIASSVNTTVTGTNPTAVMTKTSVAHSKSISSAAQIKTASSVKLKNSVSPLALLALSAKQTRPATRRKSIVAKLARSTSVLKQSKSPLKPGVKRRTQVVKSVAQIKKPSTPVTVAFLPKDKREEYIRLKRELAEKQKKQAVLKGKAEGLASVAGDTQLEAVKKSVGKGENAKGEDAMTGGKPNETTKVPDLRAALAKSLVEAELEVLICRAREVEEARSRYNTGAQLVARAKRELAAAEALHLAYTQQLVDSGDRCKAHMNSCRLAFDKWTSSKNVLDTEKETLSDKFEELSRRTAQALQNLNIVKYRVDVCGWDPDAILCPHELAGACHNPACSFLHLDRPS